MESVYVVSVGVRVVIYSELSDSNWRLSTRPVALLGSFAQERVTLSVVMLLAAKWVTSAGATGVVPVTGPAAGDVPAELAAILNRIAAPYR